MSGPIMPPNFEAWGATKDTHAQPVVASSTPVLAASKHDEKHAEHRGRRAAVESLPSPPAFPRHMARREHSAVSEDSASEVVSGEVKKLLSSAAMLRKQADKMKAEARRRTTEAAEAEAVDRYLSHAQEELSAYGATIKKLIDTSSSRASLHEQLKTFPKEAAELHALVDHSMSEADAAAVRITRAASQPQDARVQARGAAPKRAIAKHEQHRSFMSEGGQVLHSAPPASKDAKQQAQVAKVMKKLKAVKAFEHAHAAMKQARLQELVQPSPLVGAVNVENGELIEGAPFLKYNTSLNGLEHESAEEIEKENEEDTEKEDSHAYLCNATCKDAIVDSVVGLSVKVATKCIPECAKSDYIMRTKGEPLPAWTTIDELKEQDDVCTGDDEYQTCKLEALRPACNKIGDFVPQYCLINSKEGICNQCRMLQAFAEEKGLEFDLEEDEGSECEEGDEDCDEAEEGAEATEAK